MQDEPMVPDTPLAARRPRSSAPGMLFRRTTMRRAIAEGVIIFAAGRLLGMVPISFWPGFTFILIQLLRLVLSFSPPVWAAMRVVSTRREKMSRRFWWLGVTLAVFCTLADAAIGLLLGEATAWGPAQGGSYLARFSAHGPNALTPLAFVGGELATFALLTIYYTIAVVCTRLANGGFLRFTMPAGKGRVTL
jgi:hypothetical protein